ncbi:LPXTG cell wall anchor domain-containing protein [Weissella confusa]|uniref:LPXTG cell wall anchor domain-containing protein n=1 Tax=Weissella confusa TaxID=1583 RepID=UPI00223B00A2|nr:LPXTG cell wall anchor domain-containing protein [Weissella confusa]
MKTTTDNTYTGKPGTELPTPMIPGYTAKVTKVTVPDGGGDITVVYTKVPDTPVVPASTEPATPLAPTQAAPIITTNKSDDTPVPAPENDGKNHADLMLPKTGVSARSSLSVIGLLVAGSLAMFAMLFRPTRRRKTNK